MNILVWKPLIVSRRSVEWFVEGFHGSHSGEASSTATARIEFEQPYSSAYSTGNCVATGTL
jgi:hypothetical protein